MAPIIVLFPVLFVLVLSDKTYPQFYKVARFWGKLILFGMGFYYKIDFEQQLEKGKSYMLVTNHTSMTDIMLMLAIESNPFVFVGKKELTKIPIFGFFYKRSCIIVDRSDSKSRKAVFDEARKKLSNGLDVCIFPEGLVPGDERVVLADFKNGAFRLAIEHQIPIVPITMYDCKKRFSYTFFSGSTGILRTKVHHFIKTEGLTLKNSDALKKQTFDLIYNELFFDMKNKEKNT